MLFDSFEAYDVQAVRKESREAELAEGREAGRAEALVHTYQKLNQPKEDAINALVDDYNIPKENAIKLVETYWK